MAPSDKGAGHILVQGSHIPLSSIFPFKDLFVWVKFGLCSDFLHPLYQPQLRWHRLSRRPGYLPWACARPIRAWISLAVSCSAACWEVRYLWRFCKRADTVSCLTLPQGIEGAVHCGVVGGGEETRGGGGVHIYLEMGIKPAWLNLWLQWSETLVEHFANWIVSSWEDTLPYRAILLLLLRLKDIHSHAHTVDLILFFLFYLCFRSSVLVTLEQCQYQKHKTLPTTHISARRLC